MSKALETGMKKILDVISAKTAYSLMRWINNFSIQDVCRDLAPFRPRLSESSEVLSLTNWKFRVDSSSSSN